MKKFQFFITMILFCAILGTSTSAYSQIPLTSAVQVIVDQNGFQDDVDITSISITVYDDNALPYTLSKPYNNERIITFYIVNSGHGTIIPDADCEMYNGVTKHLKSYYGSWPNSNGIKTIVRFQN